METISAASTIYVRATIDAKDEQGLPRNPTGDTVQVGFSMSDAAPSTWQAADWVTNTNANPVQYRARTLLTAGTLAAGIWTMWVKITDSPEVPVIPADQIRIV